MISTQVNIVYRTCNLAFSGAIFTLVLLLLLFRFENIDLLCAFVDSGISEGWAIFIFCEYWLNLVLDLMGWNLDCTHFEEIDYYII